MCLNNLRFSVFLVFATLWHFGNFPYFSFPSFLSQPRKKRPAGSPSTLPTWATRRRSGPTPTRIARDTRISSKI